jgi:amino acid transporter
MRVEAPSTPFEIARPRITTATRDVPRKATIVQLVFITYGVICGGAYGLESMVSSSGPGVTLLALTVLPLIYAAPISLVCTELASRFPIEGGYYRWARMAFGDIAGYTAAWLMWLAMFATNASFAVLFGNYLRYFLPTLSAGAHVAISAAVVWMAVFLNYRGISVVGRTSVVFAIVVLFPFALMTALALAHWEHNPVAPFANPGQPLRTSLLGAVLIAMWLYGGFEKMTVNAEEIEQSPRAFPIALGIALPLCVLSYILPTFAALAAIGDWQDWGDAHFIAAATQIGGRWFGVSMAAGALVSNAGLVTMTLLSQSRLPMVLAEDGLFPRAFERRHRRFGTPVVSLVVTGIGLTCLVGVRFEQLAGAAALIQSLSYLLIYAAYFKLRRRPRTSSDAAFAIPLSTTGLALLVAPSICIIVLVIQQGLFADGRLEVRQAALDLAILASGPITYSLSTRDWRRS